MRTDKTVIIDAKKQRWVVARALAVLGVVSASVVVAAPHASAASNYTPVRHWQTGRCLDSDDAGRVYTLPCQQGNLYQTWILTTRPGPGGNHLGRFQNAATGRYLASDGWSLNTTPADAKQDTTSSWEGLGNDWQNVNLRANSGLVDTCLASDVSGNAYTAQCDGGDWQDWKHGF